MATLTVRNIPDDSKHRFRQVAAAHGRSMEEHLRQLVIEADFGDAGSPASHVAQAPQTFRPSGEEIVHKLIAAADGEGFPFADPRKYADIRFSVRQGRHRRTPPAGKRRRLQSAAADEHGAGSAGSVILVDTNVWSELARPQGSPAVLAWLEANDADLALSTLVVAEIRYGIELIEDTRKRTFLEAWLEGVESRYWGVTWAFDGEAAHAYGRLAALPEARKRKPQVIDIQLAAQAQSRNCPVATRNARDFDWTGVALIDPWQT